MGGGVTGTGGGTVGAGDGAAKHAEALSICRPHKTAHIITYHQHSLPGLPGRLTVTYPLMPIAALQFPLRTAKQTSMKTSI